MRKKHVYYLTTFVCGLSVMGIEMSAARLISPYFGSTNLIWTVIISLIMVGMGAGSYLGGRLADRYRSESLLYGLIAAASLWTALLPLIAQPVIQSALYVTTNMASNALLVSAILASVVMFVPPLILLGVVSPYLAKLCVQDLAETGIVLGRLSFVNTIGSILGSVLPAFVLIPTIGVKRSFLLFAALLLIVCAVYWLSNRQDRRRLLKVAAVAVPLVVVAAFSNADIAFDKPTYETESMYQYIKVDKEDGYTALSTGLNDVYQTLQMDDPDLLLGIYTDGLAALPMLYSERDTVRILQIGYGGGTVSRSLAHFYDNIDLTCVEIDQKIVDVARTYFGADPSDRVFVDDGRAYLQRTDEIFDIIIVDAYHDSGIPLDLVTKEFFTQCQAHLAVDGLMVMNVSAGIAVDTPFSRALGSTIGDVFTDVTYVPIPDGISGLIFGANAPIPFEETYAQFANQGFPELLRPALRNMAMRQTQMERGGEVFTDDRNSAELLQLEAIAMAMEHQA